jgi:U3 small nucleolar RNA-associated protein 21
MLYNLDKLRIERISPPLESKITCFAMHKNKVFTGVKNKIILWDKIHIIKEYEIPEDENENLNLENEDFFYTKILIFDKIIFASGSNGDLFLFDIHSGSLVKRLRLGCDIVIHPPTYLNKIVYTQKSQSYQEDLMLNNTKIIIFNINTEKKIYEIDLEKILYDNNYANINNVYNNSNIKITCIEISPIIDVVGIGLNSGEIIIYNIKQDKKLLSFKTETAVKTLSFSSCVELNLSLLSSADSRGNIQFWDLNKETLIHTIKAKNESHSVDCLMFLPNEPILLASSGSGNYIKMFKLEANTGTPALLRARAGHTLPPHKVRFYGGAQIENNFNNHLLSISNGEFRNISMINEHLSREFSLKNLPKEIKHQLNLSSSMQKFFNDYHNGDKNLNNFNLDSSSKKSLAQEDLEKMLANNFSDFDFNEFRERDWSNILVKITNSAYPLLFSYENSAISEKKVQIKNEKSSCTSICVSMCGNFGFSGHENGAIEKFNMQSGLSKWAIASAHTKPIIALRSDSINSLLISAGLDQKLKFWEIFQSSLVKEIDLPSIPVKMELHRDNDLIAVACGNYDIYVYDKTNFKMVRKLENFFKGKINDIAFGNDGKWICAVSEDKSLKIFDLISNNLIEWIEFKNIPLSLSVSPTSQYFAITFSNKKGVFIWLNRTVFADFIDMDANRITKPLKVCITLIGNFVRKLKSRKEIAEKEREEALVRQINKSEKAKKKKELEIIQEENKDLVILSKENRLKYRILNNLEKIQERSEPQVKKKEKAKAPFFLFNINDLLGGANKYANDNKGKEKQEVTEDFMNILKNYSHFKNEKIIKDKTESEKKLMEKKELILIELLEAYNNKGVKASEITLFLNSLNPYLIDLEIRNLDPFLNVDVKNSTGNNTKFLETFVDYLNEQILDRDNFEMIQAYLNRFLKVFIFY